MLYVHSIKNDMFGFDLAYHDYFYYGGNLIDTDIPEEKVRGFVKKHKSTFDMLADEFIKKIKNFEK